ncbi:hypothetical protein GCK72_020362 [Caenorhabditis remanei]|uniref:Uncharacterized protein n=1 Tax=Caenorhabditis remanei TaxID=31234 RepID=A0A6A5GGV8_CAERE|nr:hypothetical protein GCK72_020362 [Caenorhabditis remanei]KAF1753805.1 hypothetical protein GCK72_020362 [Caenorhabditis remanei]
MTRLTCVALVFVLFAVNVAPQMVPRTQTGGGSQPILYVPLGGTAEIKLPKVANYRRVLSETGVQPQEYIFRVCNGKNKKTCGFWENTKNKTDIIRSPTSYNKNKKALIVKKFKVADYGLYTTGNRDQFQFVQPSMSK